MSKLMAGFTCGHCGNEDMCVSLEEEDIKILVCIPCLNEVRQDWLDEEADKPKLTRIK